MAKAKKIAVNLFMAVLLAAFLGVVLYTKNYHDKEYEYPIVILENIIADNIPSPEAYKRTKDKKKEKPTQITVEIAYTYNNAAGEKVDGQAGISYISRWDFEDKFVPCLTDEEKAQFAENRKDHTGFPYEELVIESLMVNGREFTQTEIETLNTELMEKRDNYPYEPPAPKPGGTNYFAEKCGS